MQITERTVGDIVILDLDGRLIVEDGVTPFTDKMNALVRHGHKRILLNFALVSYLDSSGVGAVVWKFVTAGKQNCRVKLLHLTHKSQNVLFITKLTTVFQAFDDEQTAIDSFELDEDAAEENTILTRG